MSVVNRTLNRLSYLSFRFRYNYAPTRRRGSYRLRRHSPYRTRVCIEHSRQELLFLEYEHENNQIRSHAYTLRLFLFFFRIPHSNFRIPDTLRSLQHVTPIKPDKDLMPYISRIAPVTTMLMRDTGIKTFQPIAIS